MTTREIAEKILKDGPHAPDVAELARAYLELEKELSLLKQDLDSEKRNHKIFREAAEGYLNKFKEEIVNLKECHEQSVGLAIKRHEEITKLKEEIDKLSEQECMNCGAWLVQSNVLEKYSNKMIDELKSEITKLKKSREGLRSVCEFYASSDQWNCTKEQLTTYNTIDKDDLGVGDFQFACDVDDDRVGGKKAREALKADDELMKEV